MELRTGGVAYEDVMIIPYQVSVHKGSVGLEHDKGGWLVVPYLLREGDLEPVNYWLSINLGSGIDNGALQATPCHGRHEFALQEDPHIGGRKVYGFFYVYGVHVRIFHREHPQYVHLGDDVQGGVYHLLHWV